MDSGPGERPERRAVRRLPAGRRQCRRVPLCVAFFMLGAYMAYTLAPHIGFFPSVLVAALIIGAFGMLFESTLIRPLYGRLPEYTLLLTYGTALIFEQVVRRVWGDDAVNFPGLPSWLQGNVSIAGYAFPIYKDVFLVALITL